MTTRIQRVIGRIDSEPVDVRQRHAATLTGVVTVALTATVTTRADDECKDDDRPKPSRAAPQPGLPGPDRHPALPDQLQSNEILGKTVDAACAASVIALGVLAEYIRTYGYLAVMH
ncbi:hypothetical protein GCM10025762_00350 [Haloechinothrix salitolerans]